MKKIVLFLLCLAGLQTQAQQSSLLWKVTGNGITKPSWLYGTFHLICPEDLHISDAAKTAIKSADTLYLEINMEDQQDLTAAQQMMMPSPGFQLKNVMSADDYAFLVHYIQDSMHMSEAVIAHLKPSVLMMLLAMKDIKCQASSVEEALTTIAKETSRPQKGLETAVYQLQLLNQIPDSVIIASIIDDLKHDQDSKEKMDKMTKAYVRGDLNELYDVSKTEESFKQIEEKLLKQRNLNWIPQISNAVKHSSLFIAVGAGHLPGPDGVINLLRKQGYKVEPVM
ncbi:TraB/GumN family protein [Chitinophaga sp. Cy-1792]|uniref:TraB/GumN family protein n=1 Tax=Chitinophaga sp. Cy-1792 TaxID=2608339 RepID=UPI0014245914|nr:TraB/GumN family protein [Chitinophaga sp. Cy-1792]NIG53971.1 TraB/GumN family protein [Chitinophaga sp. Cy-1792]